MERSVWVLPTGIVVVCAALAAASTNDPRWLAMLDYRRADVLAGEVWRLVSAHAMHLSAEHAVLDIAGLAAVAWIFSAAVGWKLQAAVCLVGIGMIDLALWFLGVDRYAGLSGVLHAWFAAGAVAWLLASTGEPLSMRKRIWGVVLSVGLVVKLVLEQRHQAFWIDGAAFPVATAAHRWGAMAGVVCAVAAALLRRRAVARGAARVSRDR